MPWAPGRYGRPEPLMKLSDGGKRIRNAFSSGNGTEGKSKVATLAIRVDPAMVRGKRVIHTTSAGTQGIVNAVHADEIITGSFVNAKAISEYVRKKAPEKVSLVCMGKEGLAKAEEDELCAEYLKALLTDGGMPGIDRRLSELRLGGGSHFFDPDLQEIYPEQDYWMCIARDRFSFVLQVVKDREGYLAVKRETGI